MSIYLVKLKEWFPKGDKNHKIAKFIVSISKCVKCGKTPRWRNSIGYHALPYGYSNEVWCNRYCLGEQ